MSLNRSAALFTIAFGAFGHAVADGVGEAIPSFYDE